jgi:hypothetical protein
VCQVGGPIFHVGGSLNNIELVSPLSTFLRKWFHHWHVQIYQKAHRSMIPLWSIPMAIATGNTVILKPSERDPGAAMIIAELCERAGR